MANLYEQKRIVNTFILASVLIFIMILVPSFLGFSQTGFDSKTILEQFFMYSASGIGFLLGILLIWGVELVIKKGDAKYGSGVCFSSPGELPGMAIFKKVKLIHLILGSFAIFLILGMFTIYTHQTSFTGISFLAMEFTPVSSILFSAFLIPAAENAGVAFLIAILIMTLRSIARRNYWNGGSFLISAYILVPLAAGLFGLGNHMLRYQGQDIALLTVFIFWAFGGALTVMTGSFVPFWVMHISNNLMIDLQRYFSSDTAILIMAVIIGVIVISFITSIFLSPKKKKGGFV